MKIFFAAILALSTASCRFLDFGGDNEKAFEARFFWDRIPKIGEEDKDNPGFDKDGNKIPSPEVLATYYFPDVVTGLNVVVQPSARMTPILGVELGEFKVPYLRWFSVQFQGGADLGTLYVGKRLTSVFEITMGPWIGWDFQENERAWGIGGTILKF